MCLSEQLNPGVAGRVWASLLPSLPLWILPPPFDRIEVWSEGGGSAQGSSQILGLQAAGTGPAVMSSDRPS